MPIARRGLPRFVVCGLISVTVFYPTLICAFRYTSVAVGTLLLYLARAHATIAGAVLHLGESLTLRKIIALVTALAGCALILENYRPEVVSANALGIAPGIGSAICYACPSLIGNPRLYRYTTATVTCWYLSIGALGMLAVKLTVDGRAWPSLTGGLIVSLSCGLFMTALAALFSARGLSGPRSSDASIMAMAEPVPATGWAAAILGERLRQAQPLGVRLVLASLLLPAVRGRPTRAALTPQASTS